MFTVQRAKTSCVKFQLANVFQQDSVSTVAQAAKKVIIPPSLHKFQKVAANRGLNPACCFVDICEVAPQVWADKWQPEAVIQTVLLYQTAKF